jgi:hypothetical protein
MTQARPEITIYGINKITPYILNAGAQKILNDIFSLL